MRANAASWLAAISLSMFMVVACTTIPAPRPEPQEDLSAPGANVAIAQFRPEPMTAGAVSARVSGIAAILAGSDVPTLSPEEIARAFAATPDRVDLLVESAARISVHVDASRGELLVVQGAVADDVTSNTDIGMSGPAPLRRHPQPASRPSARGVRWVSRWSHSYWPSDAVRDHAQRPSEHACEGVLL